MRGADIRFAQGWADEADLAEAVRSAREAIEGREADPTALAWAANALALIARDYDAGLAAARAPPPPGPTVRSAGSSAIRRAAPPTSWRG